MNQSSQAKNILKEVFGYDQFRPLQEEVIRQVLDKKDALVVMPTGGGKSLCYQIPALIFNGLTVVVSPLISLMKDQVEQLNSVGISAVYLNSSLSFQEYQQNISLIKRGETKLLYLAPETLLKPQTRSLLSDLKVDCLTIDEAHCISEWGHDFRPEYRQIAELRPDFPEAVCMALTATATPRVQKDIQKNLAMKDSDTFIASFNRKNLFLEVVEKMDPLHQTLSFLEKHKKQSGIIYCFSRKQVDELAGELETRGYSVKPYHAGLAEKERTGNQEVFIRDDVQIMVATIAFGMGINKPDVRFVVHYDLPKNIESYYQQIGRAGRDGLRADCLLLFSYSDIGKINYFINQKEGQEKKIAHSHLDALIHYAETDQCRRLPLMKYFGETYPDKGCEMCDNCVYEDTRQQDLTIPAQKLISCVVRTGELFGIAHISAVLRGSKAKKVLKHKHDRLSTYGIGREFSKKQWGQLARKLIREGYLSQDPEFGSLKIESSSQKLLKGEKKLFGTISDHKKERSERSSGTSKSFSIDYDETLFELLRKERKLLADEENLPPYTIFPDATLMEMAYYYPQKSENLLNMYGVGKARMSKYGSYFLEIISDYCKEHNLKERPKKVRGSRSKTKRRRHHEVGEAYEKGSSIQELMSLYDVKAGTIINHLEKYFSEGYPVRIDGIISASSLSDEQRKQVIKVFGEKGDEMLKPVYDALNESVSYDELRLIRLYNKVGNN